MSISKNIKIIRERYGLTQQDLADIAGVTNKAVSAWESGTKEPRMGAIEKIAQRFGILKSNIIEENGMENVHLNNRPADPAKRNSQCAPLYGSIAAGTPLEMIRVDEYVDIPDYIAERYPLAFLLKVTGDSMSKIVPDGAYALIDPCDEANNGDVAAVVVDGNDVILKRFYKLQNTIVLEPDSYVNYPVQTFDSSKGEVAVKVIGRLVWFMSPFNIKY